jgi:hypothetical protein
MPMVVPAPSSAEAPCHLGDEYELTLVIFISAKVDM